MARRFPLIPLALLCAAIAVPARAGEAVAVRAAEHEHFGRIAVEWRAPVAFSAKLDGATLTIHFARPFAAQLGVIARKLDHYVASAAQSADGTTIVAQLKKPVEIKTAIINRTTVAVDLVAFANPPPEKAASETPAAKNLAAKSAPKAAAAAPPPAAPAPAAAPLQTARVRRGEIGCRRTAGDARARPHARSWSCQPALRLAARHRRGGVSPRRGLVDRVRSADHARSGRSARQRSRFCSGRRSSSGRGATALRLVTADGINPGLRRSGTAWIVDLARQDATAEAPIAVEARPAATLPAVELHVGQAGLPLRLRDPVIGDDLVVVPVAELGRGIDVTRSFVDFRLLPSVQGIVIRPNSDDLDVHADAAAVEITRPNGLVLSDEHDRLLGRAIADQHRIFDFVAWRGPKATSFIAERSALDRAIADAPPAARTEPRLALARYYFANFFAPETLSVLEQIERDDPQAASGTGVRAMKGAACLLAGDDACARDELGQSTLDDEPEAALWRGSLATNTGDWPTAAREFLLGIGLISLYPEKLRDRFALEAAEAMIETDRSSAAGPLIDMVLNGHPPLGAQAMALYLSGRREQQMGHLEPALEIWVKVAAMGDRPSRARALYARAMALYDAHKVGRADTINALDALRFSWRGDIFEFTLLRRLGELELAEGDAESGLDALHEAAIYFPDYPAAKDVAKEAADTFAALFTGKSADDMPPVKALALYDEFHDLEPAGDRGDAVVKKLVDRLVSVDLLDRAAALLADQVSNRLTGRDQARAATQLALLRLMNGQPDQAVAALDIDVAQGLTPDLTRQRQELRARAELDLNRSPDALATLAGDDSVDADRLRADIYWRQRDWKNAAKMFAALVGQPPAAGSLDAPTAQMVLAWAAALTLDGDQAGIAKLRESLGAAMAGTPSADAFKVIADDGSDATAAGGTPSEIAARIAQLGALQSFMTAYQQRVAVDKLSAIN